MSATEPTLRCPPRLRASVPLFMTGGAIATVVADWLFAESHPIGKTAPPFAYGWAFVAATATLLAVVMGESRRQRWWLACGGIVGVPLGIFLHLLYFISR